MFLISAELTDILLEQILRNMGSLECSTRDVPLARTVVATPVLPPLQEFDLLKESAVVHTNFRNLYNFPQDLHRD